MTPTNPLDQLEDMAFSPLQSFALWACIVMMAMLCVASVSFATGLAWESHLHPAILKALVWVLEVQP